MSSLIPGDHLDEENQSAGGGAPYIRKPVSLVLRKSASSKVVALDFDGVINSYASGWQGHDKTDDPVPGAADAVRTLQDQGYRLVIYSARANEPKGIQAIRDFLSEKLNIDPQGIDITDKKPIADVYVDDRAINFSGDWDKTLEAIAGFKSWIEKSLTFSGWKLQGRRKIHGIDISIENKKGSVRRGKDKDGHKWATKMHADYGYFRGTVGKDKDHLDCYVGPNPDSRRVFIIHQNDPTTGAYDEDKCMLGFDSPKDAKTIYLKQYDRPGFFGSMEETDIETFKEKAMAKKNHGKKLVIKKSAKAEGARVLTTGELREASRRLVRQVERRNPEELAVGVKVEMEHTKDPETAKVIAVAHISSDADYYKKLIAAGLVDEPEALDEAQAEGLAKSGDWKNHKYIKKVGNKYFYTEDEIRNFKLTRKSDGFFYMDEQKITNDPEKARMFEEKVREHKETHNEVKVGEKVQIKNTQTGSMGRGLVGTVKELGEDFARVADEAGRVFRVPTKALVYARSMNDPDAILCKATSTRLVVPLLQKSRKNPRLVPIKRQVTRDNVTYTTTYWVLPDQAKNIAQNDLFSPAPAGMAAQLDLFSQPPASDPVGRDKQVAAAIRAATPETRNKVQAVVMGESVAEEPDPEESYHFTPTKTKLEGKRALGVPGEVDDYTSVAPKKISLYSAEKVVGSEPPSWMPSASEEFFEKECGRFPFFKIGTNQYLVKTSGGYQYALVNLDVMVAMNDFYAKRAKKRVKQSIVADTEIAMARAKKKLEELDGREDNANTRAERNYWVSVLSGDFKSRIRPFRVIGDNKMTYTHMNFIQGMTGDKNQRNAWAIMTEMMDEYRQKASDMAIQLEDNQSSYAKGQATSYGDSGTKDDLLDQYGVKVKRQNGDEITEAEIGDIRGALDSVFGCFGDRSSMARNYGLKISHSGDKLMHARRALGIYFPTYRAIGVTAQLGDKHMGFILSHEWAHFMDNYVGGERYHYASDEPGSLANRIASTFRVSMMKKQKSDYQNRTCECFARAFEEHFSIKSGDAEILQEYRVGQGNYVDPEQFKKVVAPLIETFLTEKAEMLKAMRVSLWSLK